jgi:hypothetical protein
LTSLTDAANSPTAKQLEEYLAPGIRTDLKELESNWEVFDSERPGELVPSGA